MTLLDNLTQKRNSESQTVNISVSACTICRVCLNPSGQLGFHPLQPKIGGYCV